MNQEIEDYFNKKKKDLSLLKYEDNIASIQKKTTDTRITMCP
jgi:hypothetical protein